MTKFSLPLFTGRGQLKLDFPDVVTQAIDFGPSVISGIGNLTARDLDGCCIGVVVGGDSAKGDAES